MTALGFVFILTILTSGVCWFVVGHQQRADLDTDYAAAMDLAEAGANYELRNISTAASGAHQSPGTTVALGGGNFTVYCANTDGTTPWSTSSSTVLIVSTGTYGGVSRTVKVACKTYSTSPGYVSYSLGTTLFNLTPTVTGDMGTNTNSGFTLGTGMSLTGTLYLNNGATGTYSGYTVVHNSTAPTWNTVTTAAAPHGGLAGLAVTNDNSMASPSIPGDNKISTSYTFYGKAGGANYYAASFSLPNSKTITLDNRNGPINIWLKSDQVFTLNDSDTLTALDSSQANAVTIYVTKSVSIHDRDHVDATIVCYGDGVSDNITIHDDFVLNGSLFAGTNISIHDRFTGTYRAGNYVPTDGYFGYDSSWLEYNPR